jgi:hypothetical protein
MDHLNLPLSLGVLACVWLFVAARRWSASRARRGGVTVLVALLLAGGLAAAQSAPEWIVRQVAGNSFTGPARTLEAAQAGATLSPVQDAHLAGHLQASWARDRQAGLSLAMAALICLLAGAWAGRRATAVAGESPRG